MCVLILLLPIILIILYLIANRVEHYNYDNLIEAYYINLDRRPDRMQEFLKRINIPGMKRFQAIDGKTLTITPEIQHLFRNNNFNSHPSVVACALSHYEIWKKSKDNQFTIIMEDDLKILPNHDLNQIPDDAIQDMKSDGLDVYFIQYYPSNDEKISIGGAACYIISKTGIEKLLNHIDEHGIYEAIDTFVMNAPSLKIRYLIPLICENNYNDSDIQSDQHLEHLLENNI